jgi:hypothetical protein
MGAAVDKKRVPTAQEVERTVGEDPTVRELDGRPMRLAALQSEQERQLAPVAR